jgi:hypothetical protein
LDDDEDEDMDGYIPNLFMTDTNRRNNAMKKRTFPAFVVL